MSLAQFIAQYGGSASTSWLERERYQLWRPSEPIQESSFIPVQGYMETDHYIFAWGDPLVSSPLALPSVARQFAAFCQQLGKKPVWLCINKTLSDILAEELGWCALSCVTEDEVDPAHIMELTSSVPKGKEGQHVKDLKKNLAKAEKAGVHISEIKSGDWTEDDRTQTTQGVARWKAGRHGIQLASSSFQPWVDFEHRRYWVARVDKQIVGVLLLTPVKFASWQIKNCASFPSAPRGTSEALIYSMLRDVDQEWSTNESVPPIFNLGEFIPFPSSRSPTGALSSDSSPLSDSDRIDDHPFPLSSSNTSRRSSYDGHSGGSEPHSPNLFAFTPVKRSVTFGLSASPKLEAVHHLSGWKVKALINTYSSIMSTTGLLRRGEFRHKFNARQVSMYISYPNNGFGLKGANALLKTLRR